MTECTETVTYFVMNEDDDCLHICDTRQEARNKKRLYQETEPEGHFHIERTTEFLITKTERIY